MLLDLSLALVILLLLTVIVWPLAGSGTNGAMQAALALDIATVMKADRRTAQTQNVSAGTVIDLNRRTVVGSSGRSVVLPRDLALEVRTARRCTVGAGRFAIMFTPEGKSCGGVILLTKGTTSYAVRINWLSGMIDVADISQQ